MKELKEYKWEYQNITKEEWEQKADSILVILFDMFNNEKYSLNWNGSPIKSIDKKTVV